MKPRRKTFHLEEKYYFLFGRRRAKDRFEPLMLDFDVNEDDITMAVATKQLGTMHQNLNTMRRMKSKLLSRGWKDIIIGTVGGVV